MSKQLEQFREDRAIRDAARAVLLADIEHARASFSAKGVAQRVGTRIGDGAKDVLEVAKDQADSSRGIIAVLIGAVLLWLGRDTILEALGLAVDEDGAQPDTQIEEPSPEFSPPGDDNEQ